MSEKQTLRNTTGTQRKSTKNGKERGGSEELSESGNPEADESAGEKEPMDYSEVLVTSGTTAPKPPCLAKECKLDTNCKQSRADITDLIQELSVYFARVLRVHNAKIAAVVLKGGEDQVRSYE